MWLNRARYLFTTLSQIKQCSGRTSPIAKRETNARFAQIPMILHFMLLQIRHWAIIRN